MKILLCIKRKCLPLPFAEESPRKVGPPQFFEQTRKLKRQVGDFLTKICLQIVKSSSTSCIYTRKTNQVKLTQMSSLEEKGVIRK